MQLHTESLFLDSFLDPSPNLPNFQNPNHMLNTLISPLCWVIFNQDYPATSPAFPTKNVGGTDPLTDTGAAPASQAPTKNSNPKTATPMAIEGIKSNPNGTCPMDGPGMESDLAANRESAVALADSSGTSDTNSYYTNSSDNSPASLKNHMELATQIHELDQMHK